MAFFKSNWHAAGVKPAQSAINLIVIADAAGV
jgi:hypothetical protein